MNEQNKAQQALTQIVAIAKSAIENTNSSKPVDNNGSDSHSPDDLHVGCSIKALPSRLAERGAEVATRINPVNAPQMSQATELALVTGGVLDPQALTLLTTKYWGPIPRRLTVSFMEATPADLRRRIISHLNAWSRTACISFVATNGVGQIRISRGAGGYWSYLGTDVLLIPRNRPTMNLQGFTMNTPESEFRRVVRHEAGHTLGFPHEHMRQELINRIDPEKAYAYFQRTQGWNRQMVDQQVLTPLNALTIIGTPPDQDSIMCYQLPGSITRDGRPIRGGADINATDYQFAGRVYPKVGWSVQLEEKSVKAAAADWDESEDVSDADIDATIREIMTASQGLELEG